MLVTDRKDLNDRYFVLYDRGRALGEKRFRYAEVVYMYKMCSSQPLVLHSWERIDEIAEWKKQSFSWYRQNLGLVDWIMFNCGPFGTKNYYWMVMAIFDQEFGFLKEDFVRMIKVKGIDSRPLFYPLRSIPAYSPFASPCEAHLRNMVSYRVSHHGVNFPRGGNMTWESVGYVYNAIKGVLSVGLFF